MLQEITLRDSSGAALQQATPWAPGTYDIYFDIPDGVTQGNSLATRVRLSSAGGLGVGGLAQDGEVEDYVFNMPNAISLRDFSAERSNDLVAGLALVGLLGVAVVGWRLRVSR